MLPTDDYRDVADSDVVVVTVGANIKAGQSRLEVLGPTSSGRSWASWIMCRGRPSS